MARTLLNTYRLGPLAADAKFWCLVKGTLPGIGVKLQLTNRDFGIAPLTELNGESNARVNLGINLHFLSITAELLRYWF